MAFGASGGMSYTARDSAMGARRRHTSLQEIQLMVLTPDFDSRPVISFQHVWKTYPTGTEALRDINLVVPEGDFLFLVGPSGAGKSTLVRLLIREEKPTKGKIFVDGVELGRMKRRQLPFYRRKVGLVFQDFKLLPNLTIYENVAFALRVHGQPDGFMRTRARGATVVMATHNREIVDLLRRRVVAIDAGQIARDDRSGRYHDDSSKSQIRAQ